mgnify:CR=1 FL=1
MGRNKTYKIEKPFKVESTFGSIDLKGRLIEYRSELPSYYIVTINNASSPYLIDKKSIDSKISKSHIVEVEYQNLNDKYDLYWSQDARVPIKEDSLLDNGFIKTANIYYKEGFSLQLIKGHTWHLTNNKDYKFSKDVKFIDQISDYMKDGK